MTFFSSSFMGSGDANDSGPFVFVLFGLVVSICDLFELFYEYLVTVVQRKTAW